MGTQHPVDIQKLHGTHIICLYDVFSLLDLEPVFTSVCKRLNVDLSSFIVILLDLDSSCDFMDIFNRRILVRPLSTNSSEC